MHIQVIIENNFQSSLKSVKKILTSFSICVKLRSDVFAENSACEFRIPQENPAMKYVYDELLQGRAHELLHIHYPDHDRK